MLLVPTLNEESIMRQLLRAAAVSALACFIAPAFADDEKKVDEKKPDAKKDVDKEEKKKGPGTVDAGSLTGKIININETKKELKLRIEYAEINQGELQAIQRDQLEIQRVLATERNPNTRANRVNQLTNSILNHQKNLYKKSHKDVDFTTVEDFKVRMMNPPPKFDEKGRIVKHTQKELDELKGEDKKLPGYNAEFSDLRQNQIVKVNLVRKKGTPKVNPPAPDKKDVDKPNPADVLAEFAPHITMIIIMADPPPQ